MALEPQSGHNPSSVIIRAAPTPAGKDLCGPKSWVRGPLLLCLAGASTLGLRREDEDVRW